MEQELAHLARRIAGLLLHSPYDEAELAELDVRARDLREQMPQTRKERRQTAKLRIFQPRRKGSCANGCYSLSGGNTMKLRIATASLLIALATAACESNPVAPNARKDAPTAPVKDNGTGNWMGSGY